MNGSISEENSQILLSWIHEYAFCPRRFYLRVIEHSDAINADMVEGKILHQNTDNKRIEKRGKNIQVFSMPVYSDSLDLYGICDRVDFLVSEFGTYIPFLNENCIICPVEFKHGRKRNAFDYNQQVCAQAICLEEMFGCVVELGTVWYTKTRQNYVVNFSEQLRNDTKQTIAAIKNQIKSDEPVHTKYRKLCKKCALFEICNPKNERIGEYMEELKEKALCIR